MRMYVAAGACGRVPAPALAETHAEALAKALAEALCAMP